MQLSGGSLRTWGYDAFVDQAQIVLGTNGRPMDAGVELWSGPDNTAVSMRVYGEDGQLRPIRSSIGLGGRGHSSSVAVRNTGPLEFPMGADAFHESVAQPSEECLASTSTIQGKSLRTFRVGPYVDSVQVLLRSDGMPVNATVEIIQGPNANRQGIQLYSDNGADKPVFYILETPGYGSVVEVKNTGPIEFPILASVVPHSMGMAMEEDGDFYDDGPGGYGPRGDRRGGGRYGGIGGGGGYGGTMDDRRRYGSMMGGSMGGGDPYSGGPGGRYGGMEGGIRGGPYGGSYGEEMDFGMGGGPYGDGDMMYDESLPLRRSGYGPPMMDGRMGPPPPFYRR